MPLGTYVSPYEASETPVNVSALAGVSGYSNATTTPAMAGIGLTITPKKSGNVLVVIVGNPNSYVTGTALYYGVGSPPTAGASVPTNAVKSISATSVFAYVISGLQIGVQYWFDLAYATTTAGSGAQITGINAIAVEI